MSWNPEIDTPATIGVIGGGPCGVEAALYARFLGYSVELFEANKIGDSLLRWGNRLMPGTWREIASSLGLAALEAHEHTLPELAATPTYCEYVEQYLLPLARCDLLLTFMNNWTKVLSVSRLGCGFGDSIPIESRAEQEFRLLLRSDQRGEYSQIVDLVLDCSGGQSIRELPGSGGSQPIGWSAVASQVILGKCDCLGKRRSDFAGKHVLLIGNDPSAVANAVELAELAECAGGDTRLFWVVKKGLGHAGSQFYDEEAERQFRNMESINVVPLSAWGIESVRHESDQFLVTVQTTEDATVDLRVDKMIHCGKCIPQAGYHHNLLIEQPAMDEVMMPEPHFYRLGDRAKLAVQPNPVSQPVDFAEMYDHIRRAFSLIGGREELNLYQSVRPLAAE